MLVAIEAFGFGVKWAEFCVMYQILGVRLEIKYDIYQRPLSYTVVSPTRSIQARRRIFLIKLYVEGNGFPHYISSNMRKTGNWIQVNPRYVSYALFTNLCVHVPSADRQSAIAEFELFVPGSPPSPSTCADKCLSASMDTFGLVLHYLIDALLYFYKYVIFFALSNYA